MADEIDALLSRVEDESLRQELASQVSKLKQKRRFGLVFEDHLPESVALPQHQIRRGIKVVPRDDQGAPPLVVTKVKGKTATLTDGQDTSERPVNELVAVAEFGEPIYPGLRQLGSIERGGDKPAHVVIKGENYHALEALQFTHAGKVDCIYIDPPYNTGARDWKYNNDYVDSTDAWRHSKWLSMMKRRLVLARPLLKSDGVFVITIDEHEVNNLGAMLADLFPEAHVQMVTIVINSAGVQQSGFSRVDEYAFFVFFGDAEARRIEDDLLSDEHAAKRRTGRIWDYLLRSGTNSLASDRPNMCYPIALKDGRIVGFGSSIKELGCDADCDPQTAHKLVSEIDGSPAYWPVKSNGQLGYWQVARSSAESLLEQGLLRAGRVDDDRKTASMMYVSAGYRKRIASGEIVQVGTADDGSALLEQRNAQLRAKTVWKRPAHNAGTHGSALLSNLLGERRFDFPKSLYAVEDALRTVAGPEALVLDFFAGSGTTTHAVARLNREDGGARQSISVTNNEVAVEDVDRLTADGLQPGETRWEAQGIFEFVTRPRIEAALTGKSPAGVPIKGEYKFGEKFAISDGLMENVVFAELEYLDDAAVSLDQAFGAVAPLLWLRAGAAGPVLDRRSNHDSFAVSESYGVLFNPDRWRSFIEELPRLATHAFIVTDSSSEFASVAAELRPNVEAVRLYENYLSTFAINTGAML